MRHPVFIALSFYLVVIIYVVLDADTDTPPPVRPACLACANPSITHSPDQGGCPSRPVRQEARPA